MYKEAVKTNAICKRKQEANPVMGISLRAHGDLPINISPLWWEGTERAANSKCEWVWESAKESLLLSKMTRCSKLQILWQQIQFLQFWASSKIHLRTSREESGCPDHVNRWQEVVDLFQQLSGGKRFERELSDAGAPKPPSPAKIQLNWSNSSLGAFGKYFINYCLLANW